MKLHTRNRFDFIFSVILLVSFFLVLIYGLFTRLTLNTCTQYRYCIICVGNHILISYCINPGINLSKTQRKFKLNYRKHGSSKWTASKRNWTVLYEMKFFSIKGKFDHMWYQTEGFEMFDTTRSDVFQPQSFDRKRLDLPRGQKLTYYNAVT